VGGVSGGTSLAVYSRWFFVLTCMVNSVLEIWQKDVHGQGWVVTLSAIINKETNEF
jgi:hypothetical protein